MPWFRYEPAVFSDPQVVIPQLVPPRGRGRPTLYSPELIESSAGFSSMASPSAKPASKSV